MNRRQVFSDIMAHKTPGKVLLDLCGCPLAEMTEEAEKPLFELLGYSGNRDENREKLFRFLDIDTRGVGHILRPPKSQKHKLSDTAYIDEWGMERRYTGLYWEIVSHPLEDADIGDLEKYPWPDPESVPQSEIDEIVRKARFLHENTDYVVCASHPVYGIFELGCWMLGFEEFLVRLLTDEPFVRRFFEIITEYQKKVIDRYYPPLAPYIDFTSSGDDFATQQGLFVSPKVFESLIAPYFAERICYTKKYITCPYLHHSCGNVSSLIPQLKRCGVDILNPIQPAGPDMDPRRLKQAYGADIVFHGGLDTQRVLPKGSKEEIDTAVTDLLDTMQPGGGYIFAAAHNLQGDVPPENIIEMFRAARAWKMQA
ncbi:MAG: methyltransferase [Clostridia bacterium]|nr:methyltransferase [Clostridia bacterium]